ncbi:MAG: hypothetical protein A4S09_00490 [Proteobacteria bacterium SG_bin7]|nr:MAG: hypothetical protein A4S09_00490 [Proteobacteria bacterium SG_bin7]
MRSLKILGFISFILFLSGAGCPLQTRSQMEEKKVIQDQMKVLQTGRNEQQGKIQDVSNEVLTLNGRLETVEAKITSLDRGMQAHNRQGDQQIGEVSNRVKTLEEASLGLNQRMDGIIEELKSLRMAIDSAKKNEKPSASSKGPERGPFNTGEDEYAKGNWGEAILSYMKYREQNPTGKRYAEATFKIGYAFQQMGKAAQAKSFYQEVVNRFPSTPHAKKAQSQLQKIDK